MTAQSQRRTLLSFCSLRVPLHPTRLLPFLLRTLSFLVLDAKGGEREFVDSGGVAREGFLALCVILSCIMFIFPYLYCMTYVLLSYSCDMLCFIGLIHLTCHLFGDLLVCPASASTLFSYELYYLVLTSLVLSYEYTMLAWSTKAILNPFVLIAFCLCEPSMIENLIS
jgi:hypothetical protein